MRDGDCGKLRPEAGIDAKLSRTNTDQSQRGLLDVTVVASGLSPYSPDLASAAAAGRPRFPGC
jgi:hypothetical protein